MQLTSNYNLKKPEGTDIVDIADFNDNADIIDTQLKALNTNKVDKVSGKQLSTNDYTTAEKNKLTGIAANAQVNTVTSVVGRTGAVAVTKSDVGLGSVENYDLATQAEAEAGTAANKYMTPQRTQQAISKNLTPIQEQVTSHLVQEAKKRVNTFGIVASQSVAPNIKYIIPWTSINIRESDAIELLDGGRRVRIKIAGDYQISAIANYDESDIGYRSLGIGYDGTANAQGTYTLRTATARSASAYIYTSVQVSTIAPLLVGDIIELSTSHNAGLPLLIRTGFTSLEIIRL